MNIRFFGELVEITGKTQEDLIVDSMSDLTQYLTKAYSIDLNDFSVAINHEIKSFNDDYKFNGADEVAILSAFAGG